MAIEIERKFLVRNDDWRGLGNCVLFRQGYLQTRPCTVRVRTEGTRAVLTIKGSTQNYTRSEFEYEIPFEDATTLLDTLALRPLIHKCRYTIPHADDIWIVDEFFEENAGLVLAEIELTSEAQTFVLPSWVGAEVTHDPRYANANLVSHPYSRW